MDGALAWRRETTKSSKGWKILGLKYSTRHQAKAAHYVEHPWIEPLHPPPCQLSSCFCRAALAFHATQDTTRVNASSIIEDSYQQRLFHRLSQPCLPNCSYKLLPLILCYCAQRLASVIRRNLAVRSSCNCLTPSVEETVHRAFRLLLASVFLVNDK